MALLNLKKVKHDARKRELIRLLIGAMRLEVLVCCCAYYCFNGSSKNDAEYDTFARELCKLQEEHPIIAEEAHFAEYFKEFTTECVTGVGLPFDHPDIKAFTLETLIHRGVLDEYSEVQ